MPTINYIYHGNQYLCETDENDTPTKLYVNQPGTYTNLVSQKDLSTGEKSYPLYDAIGSTRAVTDENGDVTDTFVYDAWGNVVDRIGATDIPFQYVGKHGYYRDEETETNYVMDRAYSSRIIRWLSMDFIRTDSFANWYRYCLNRSPSVADPSGMYPPGLSPGPGGHVCDVGCLDSAGKSIDLGAMIFSHLFYHVDRKPLSWAEPDITQKANGVGIVIDFISPYDPGVGNPCCCDKYRYIQTVHVNFSSPAFAARSGLPRNPNFVDTLVDRRDPYYPTFTENDQQLDFPPGSYPIQSLNSKVSMYDQPYLPTDMRNLIREILGLDTLIAIFESCIVCVRETQSNPNNPFPEDPPDTIMSCAQWGYQFRWRNKTKYLPIRGIDPHCSGDPSDRFMKTLRDDPRFTDEKYKTSKKAPAGCAGGC